MPDLKLDLEVLDVDGRPIVDPTVVVRLARSDGSSAAAWRVPFRGFILNPFTDPDDLADTTARACGPDLRMLLRNLAVRFSRARIMVLEYYPVLSAQSRFSWGLEFLAAVGAR